MTTKVLFVDDEMNVLSGLRRMLRGQRNVWEMQFANGGAAALELLAKEPFDVVVTDMRMPEIDGAELLHRVVSLHPATVRLVLSGQSEHEKIFRAIGPAHQFLSKPCEPDVLVQTIQRACGLRQRFQDAALQGVTAQIGSLPSLPRIYEELVHELQAEECSLDRVAQIIGSDVAMTAKVLQLVNSSFFGLPQHVSCPKHAVSLLGLNIIQPLVLSADAFFAFEDPEIEGYSLHHSIEHSLAVGIAARAISQSECSETQCSDSQCANDALIAGMLHDIGKLILATHARETFIESLRLAKESAVSAWQAEMSVFGTTHAEVGAYLLGLWGLPNPILEAVAFHHRPQAAEEHLFSPLDAVYAANILQHQQPGTPEAAPCADWDVAYLDKQGLSGHIPKWQAIMERHEVTL